MAESSSAPKKNDKKGAEIGVEYGVGQIMPGSLWIDWTGESGAIINRPTVTLDQLIEMRRRDGQAKALIQLVTLPLRMSLQAGEFIEPDEGGAEAEVEFANLMWTLPPMAGGMTTPRTKLIRQMILAVTDGFAPFEIVRQVPEEGPLKNKITLRKLAYRDPNTVKINIDKQGGYNGFRQTTHTGEGDLVDISLKPLKTFLVTHAEELNPYYGVSLFESAYPHFDAKRKLYYIAHLAAQFAAVPGRVGTVPPNAKPTEVVAFREALKNFAFNTAMIAPEGYEVTPFNGNSNFDFLKLIEHHNSQMSKSILAPFFDQDQRPVLIENASQDASADLFLSCMESITEDISDAITNYLLPQFIDFNFNSKKYPVFRPGKLSDAAKTLIQESFKTVVNSSILNCTPEFVRELEKKIANQMNLDIDYEEIEKKEQEAAEQKQALEQEQAKMAAQAPPVDPNAQPPGSGGPPVPGAPQGPTGPSNGATALSNSTDTIDDLVLAAQALFLNRPDDTDEEGDIDGD